jgi:Rieske Fe-S protein
VADDLGGPENEERHEAEPHLPSPTIWPFGFAAGITLALIGLIIGLWAIVGIGVGIAVVFAFLWARDATREIRGAPPPEPEVEPEAAALASEEEVERYPRSKFLEGATLGLGAVIGGIVTVPALGFTIAPAFVGQSYGDVDLGPLANFPEGQWVIAKFASAKEGSKVSLRTAFVRNNGIVNGVPSFTIISNRCAHLGCPVRPQGLSEQKGKEVETEAGKVVLTSTNPSGFVCPCHGGAYDVEGNRTAGPPVRALDRYRYSVKNGRLVLGEPYSVAKVEGEGAKAKIEAYRLADPGQHVDGPEEWLYPPKFWLR